MTLKRLKLLSTQFLQEKEFHGAHDLVVTDAMALSHRLPGLPAPAARAASHRRKTPEPTRSAGARLVRRFRRHRGAAWCGRWPGASAPTASAWCTSTTRPWPARPWTEGPGDAELAGRACRSGAQRHRAAAANVVIHEFVHKMDMRGMSAGTGARRRPTPVQGLHCGAHASDAQAREQWWRATMAVRIRPASSESRERWPSALAASMPWLDDYAAQAPGRVLSPSPAKPTSSTA